MTRLARVCRMTGEEELQGEARRLLEPFFDARENPKGKKIRLIGVRVEKLVRDERPDAVRQTIAVDTTAKGQTILRLPAKLMPLVEEYKEKLEKLSADQGGRLTLEKGDDAKDLRRALKAAAVNRRIRFPFRGKKGP